MIPRIMVVDANVAELQSVRRELSGSYKVLCCSRGNRSFDLYNLFLPHGVVLNYPTPDLNLEDLISRIRAVPGGNRVPIWVSNRTELPSENFTAFTRSQSIFLERSARPSTVKALLDWHFGIQRTSVGVVEL